MTRINHFLYLVKSLVIFQCKFTSVNKSAVSQRAQPVALEETAVHHKSPAAGKDKGER